MELAEVAAGGVVHRFDAQYYGSDRRDLGGKQNERH